MTNFKTKKKALKLIDEILDLTGEEKVRSIIDEAIERTLVAFNLGPGDPSNYETFINQMGSFIKSLYENISWNLQKPSDDQACAEAIYILETGYQGSNGRSLYAAFLDARNPLLNGPEFILLRLSEIIKAELRMKYTRWVYVSRIEGVDWITRCSIAEIIFERWRSLLPSDILMCSPVQFADNIPDLIDMIESSNKMVFEILGTGTDWISDDALEGRTGKQAR